MNLEMDADVQRVAEFMQSNIAAAKLSCVAATLAKLASILWGHYGEESIVALRLRSDMPTTDDGSHIPTIASECDLA
jgi:hypothetical protein